MTLSLPPEVIPLLKRGFDIMCIDGRSGAGKTRLAVTIAQHTGAKLFHMDDLYPGWNSLDQAPALLTQAIGTGYYRPYNWHTQTLEAPEPFPTARPLIIEGCGSLSTAALTAAQINSSESIVTSVWIECATAERKRRALTRDGNIFTPHWDSWAAQEDQLYELTQAPTLAQVTVHTTTGI